MSSRLAATASVALVGLEGRMVGVEAALGAGLPRTVLVGLPDASLYEARDRVRAAVASSGLQWPSALLTINLSPAALPKAGSHYDLAIAVAVLAASGDVPLTAVSHTVLFGELGLDGSVRAVPGVLPGLLAAREAGWARAIVPAAQLGEAALVEGVDVRGVRSLTHLVDLLNGRAPGADPEPDDAGAQEVVVATGDLDDVSGQEEAKLALEVAAAGRHHLLLQGPPGVGKTMLAARLPGLLPELSWSEALETAAVRSLAGETAVARLDRRPPFADPHHSASMTAMVGGGPRVARPGAVSLAHRGVLFLDEAPEFSPKVLDALRTPLESGSVLLGRAQAQVRYPARFQLVLAANPCPCGWAGSRQVECACPPAAVRRYGHRLSGPILDRIDIHQTLVAPPTRLRAAVALEAATAGPGRTAAVAARVREARERQARRLASTPWSTNAECGGGHLRRVLALPAGADQLERAVERGRLTARGVDTCLRLAWTLADLSGRDRPSGDDVGRALLLRRTAAVAP